MWNLFFAPWQVRGEDKVAENQAGKIGTQQDEVN